VQLRGLQCPSIPIASSGQPFGGNTDFQSNVDFPDDNQWHHCRHHESSDRHGNGQHLLPRFAGPCAHQQFSIDQRPTGFSGTAAPQLTIQSNQSGGYIPTWPASFAGYTLPSAEALPATDWTEHPSMEENGQHTATVTSSSQNRFYRLRR
jgi:hypothetical protein